jgi:hypothetical protein
MRGVLAALSLAGAAAAADEPAVRVWQWTDRAGVVRYTPDRDRVPGYARDAAVEIRPGQGPPPTTPVYFEPDPRAPVVAVPDATPEATPPPAAARPAAVAGPDTSPTPAAAVPDTAPAPAAAVHDGSPAPAVAVPDTPPVEAGPLAAAQPAVAAPPGDDLDERIRQLETQIQADEEALKQLISAADSSADVEVSPELRAIAERLPRLQAQLASLQQRRVDAGSR